jgi:hypothetical protein
MRKIQEQYNPETIRRAAVFFKKKTFLVDGIEFKMYKFMREKKMDRVTVYFTAQCKEHHDGNCTDNGCVADKNAHSDVAKKFLDKVDKILLHGFNCDVIVFLGYFSDRILFHGRHLRHKK